MENPPERVLPYRPSVLVDEVGTYTGYWKLKDYLDVIHTLKDTNFFYFTSNKSNIVELCEWLEHNYATANPFHGATKKTIRSHMNHNSQYMDIMLYKKYMDIMLYKNNSHE